MDKNELLNRILKEFLLGRSPDAEIIELRRSLVVDDASWLMAFIESLQGPEQFMDELDEYDGSDNLTMEVIATGFFKFVDLVSAYIIMLGDEAILKTKAFENSSATYVPWVLKYCSDERFWQQLADSYPQIDIMPGE